MKQTGGIVVFGGPMRLNPKLSQQGPILIAIPLIFQLVFISTLLFLLRQAENETFRERHSRIVIAECNSLLKDFVDAGLFLYMYNASKNKNFLLEEERLIKAIPIELAALKTLLRESPNRKASLEQLQSITNKGLELIHREQELVGDPGLGIKRLSNKQELGEITEQLITKMRDFVSSMEQVESKADSQSAARARLMLIGWIATGFAVNVLLAFWLMHFFRTHTTGRLSVLVDNSRRLAQGQGLNPLIEGGDEIAELDLSFHKMADELFMTAKRKQEIVDMVSHDLRTPLTSLRGSLRLLLDGVMGSASDDMKNELQVADRNTQRLIGLINDLLDVERFQSGKVKMSMEEAAIAGIFADAEESVSALAEDHKIKIDVIESNIRVVVDRDRIVQVMINLLSNAIKFSPEASIIRVEATQLENETEVSVSDQGRGIPSDLQEAIFERFKKVETTTEDKRRGSGLGLPICKAIIEEHGGTIGVRSEAGKGSTFWFRIKNQASNR